MTEEERAARRESLVTFVEAVISEILDGEMGYSGRYERQMAERVVSRIEEGWKDVPTADVDDEGDSVGLPEALCGQECIDIWAGLGAIQEHGKEIRIPRFELR